MTKTFHIQWHITDNCNLRCRHCYQDNFSQERDLPLEKLLLIFSNICEFLERKNRKLVIDITGGEPFLYKNIWDLIEAILDSQLVKDIGVITNGFFLSDEIIYKIEKNKIILKISTEGIDKEIYEFFRGKNYYGRFIQIFEKVKEIKTKKFIMFTLFEKNIEQIEKVINFAYKYNFKGVIIERFIPYGIGKNIKNEVISFENWFKVTKFLHRICGVDFDMANILEYRGFMIKIENKKYELYGSECIVGKNGCAIMPDGTIYPCRRFPIPIGNLLNNRLFEIWNNSEVLCKIRNKIFLKGKCKNCIIDECIGCRALAYSLYNDFLEEDPLCYLKYGGKK